MFKVIFTMKIKSKMKQHCNTFTLILILMSSFHEIQGTNIYESDTCSPDYWNQFLQRSDATIMLEEMKYTLTQYGSDSPEMKALLNTLIYGSTSEALSITTEVALETELEDLIVVPSTTESTITELSTTESTITDIDSESSSSKALFQPPPMEPELLEAVPLYIDELMANEQLECSIPPAEMNDFLNKVLTVSDLSFFESPLAESFSSFSLSSSSSSSEEEEYSAMDSIFINRQKSLKRKTMISRRMIIKYLQQVIEHGALPKEFMSRLSDYIDYLGKDNFLEDGESILAVEDFTDQKENIIDQTVFDVDSTQSIQSYVAELMSNQNLITDIPQEDLGFILNQVLSGSDMTYFNSLPLETLSYEAELFDIDSSMLDTDMIIDEAQTTIGLTRIDVIEFLQQIIARGRLPINVINRLYGYLEFMTKVGQSTTSDNAFMPLSLGSDIMEVLPTYIDEILADSNLMPSISTDVRSMILKEFFTGSDLVFFESLPMPTTTADLSTGDYVVGGVSIFKKKQKKSKKTKISKKRIIKYLQQVIEKKALPSEMLTRLNDYLDFIQEDGQYTRTIIEEKVVEEVVEEKPKGKFTLAITGIDAVDIVKPVGKDATKLTLKLNGGGMKGLLEKLGSFSDSASSEDNHELDASLSDSNFKFGFPFDNSFLNSMYPNIDFNVMSKYFNGENLEIDENGAVDTNLWFETPLNELDAEEEKITQNADVLQDNWMDVIGELGLLMKSEQGLDDIDQLTSIIKDLKGYTPQQGIYSSDNLLMKKIKKSISRLKDFFASHPTMKNAKKYTDLVKGLRTNLKFSEKFFKKVKTISVRRSSIRKIVNKKKYSVIINNVQEKLLKDVPEMVDYDQSLVECMFNRIMTDLENYMAWKPSNIEGDSYSMLLARMYELMDVITDSDGGINNSELVKEIQVYISTEINPRDLSYYCEKTTLDNEIVLTETEPPLLIVEEGYNQEFVDELGSCEHLITELEGLISSRSNSLYTLKYKKITKKLSKFISNLKLHGVGAVCVEEYKLALMDLQKFISIDPSIVVPDRYLKLISDINISIDMISYDTVEMDPFIERSIDMLESYFVSNPELISRVEYSSKITKIRRYIKNVKRYGFRSVDSKQYNEIILELAHDISEDTSLGDTEMSYFLTQISDYFDNPNYRLYTIDPFFDKLLSDLEYFMSSNTVMKYSRYSKYITKLYKFVHEVERYGIDRIDFEYYQIMLTEFLEEINSDSSIIEANSSIYTDLITLIGECIENPLQGSYEIDPYIERSISDIESYMKFNTNITVSYKYYLRITKLRRYVSEVRKYGVKPTDYGTYQSLLSELVEEVKLDQNFENVEEFESLITQTSSFMVDSSYGLHEIDPFIERSIHTLESYFRSEPRVQYSKYSMSITKIYRYISEVKRYGTQSINTDVYIDTLNQITQEISKDMSIDDIDKYFHLINQVKEYLQVSSKSEVYQVDPYIERSINMLESYIQSDTRILHSKRYKKIITKIYKYISDVKIYGFEAVDLNSYHAVLDEFSQYISTDTSIENSERYTSLISELSEYMFDTSYGTYEFDPFVERSIIDLENYLKTTSSVMYKKKYSLIIRKLYKHVSKVKRYGTESFSTEEYKETVAELQSAMALDETIENSEAYVGLIGEISDFATDEHIFEYEHVDPFIERTIVELENYLKSSSGASYSTRYSIYVTKLYKYISDWRRYGVAAIDHEYYMSTLSDLMEAIHNDSTGEDSQIYINLILQISDYFDTPTYVSQDLESYTLLISELESYLTTDLGIINSSIYSEYIFKLKKFITEVKTFGKSSLKLEDYKIVLSELEKQIIADVGVTDNKYIDIISQINVQFEDSDCLTSDLDSYNMIVSELENILRSDTRISYSIKHSLTITKLHKYMSDVRRYGLTSIDTEHYVEAITQLSNELYTDLNGDLDIYSDIFSQIFSFFRTPSYVSYDFDEYSSLVSELDDYFKTEASVVYTKRTSKLIKKLYKYTSVVKRYGIGAVDNEDYKALLKQISNEISSMDTGLDTNRFSEITSQISNYFEPTNVVSEDLESYNSLIAAFENVLMSDSLSLSSSKYKILIKKLYKYTSDIERYGVSAVDVGYYKSVLSELREEMSSDATIQNNEIFNDYISQINDIFDPTDYEPNELNLYQMLISQVESVLSVLNNYSEYSIHLKKMYKYISDVKRFGVSSVDNDYYSRILNQMKSAILSDQGIDTVMVTDWISQLEGFFNTPEYVSIDLEPYCNLVTEFENFISSDSNVVYATKYSLKVRKLQKYVKRIKKYGITVVDMNQYKSLLTELSDEISSDSDIEYAGKYTNMISQISNYFEVPVVEEAHDVDPYIMLVNDLENSISQDQILQSERFSILIKKLYRYSSDVKKYGATAVDLNYYQDIVTSCQELFLETEVGDNDFYVDLLSQISEYFSIPNYVTYNSDPYKSVVSELDSYMRSLPSYNSYSETLTKLYKYSSDAEVYGKHNVDTQYYSLILSQMWNFMITDTDIVDLEMFENLISQISDFFDTSCHVEFNLDPYKQIVSELDTYIQKTTVTRKMTSKRKIMIRKLYRYINDVEMYGIDAVNPDHYNSILSELQEDLLSDAELDEVNCSNLISQISDYFVTPNYVSYDFHPYSDVLTRLDTYLSSQSQVTYSSTYSTIIKKLYGYITEAEKYGMGVVDTNVYSFALSQLHSELIMDTNLKDTTTYEELISDLSDYFDATDQNLSNLDQFDSLISEMENRFNKNPSVAYSTTYLKYIRKLRKYTIDVKRYGVRSVDAEHFKTLLSGMLSEISVDSSIDDVLWYENNISQISDLLVVPDYESYDVDSYETLISNLEDTISSSNKVVYRRKYSLKMKKLRKYSKTIKKYGISAVDTQYYTGLLSEIEAEIHTDENLMMTDNISHLFSDISTYIETPSFFLYTSDPFSTLMSELQNQIQSEVNVFQATKYTQLMTNLIGYVSNVKQYGLKSLDGEDYFSDIMQLQNLISRETDIKSVGKYSTLLMLISKAFDDSCGVLPDSELFINLLFDVENHISEEVDINHNLYFTKIGTLYDFLLDLHLFGTQGVNRDLYSEMISHISSIIASDNNIHNQQSYIGTLSRVSTYLTCNALFPYSTERFRQLMAKLEDLISQEPKLTYRYKYHPIIYDLYNYIPDFQYLGTEGTRSGHYRNILYEFRASISIEPNVIDSGVYLELISEILEEIDRPFKFAREIKPFMKLIGELDKVIESEPNLINNNYYRKHLMKLRHYISHRHAIKNQDLELDYISLMVDDIVKEMSMEPNMIDQTVFRRIVTRVKKHVRVSQKNRLTITGVETVSIDDDDEITVTDVSKFEQDFMDDDQLAMELELYLSGAGAFDKNSNPFSYFMDIDGTESSPVAERTRILSIMKRLSRSGKMSPEIMSRLTDYYQSKYGNIDLSNGLGDDVSDDLQIQSSMFFMDTFNNDNGMINFGDQQFNNFAFDQPELGSGSMPYNSMNMADPNFYFNNPVIIQPVPIFLPAPVLPMEPPVENENQEAFLSVMGAETIAKLIPPTDNSDSYTLHIEGIDSLEQLEALRAAVENNGLLVAGLDTMAVQAPPEESESFEKYIALDAIAEMYEELTTKEVEPEAISTEYELLSDLQIQDEVLNLEETMESSEAFEIDLMSTQEVIALPPHLRTLVEPMILRKSTHFIPMNTVFGGGEQIVPLLPDRYMSVFGEYVIYE